MRLRHGLAAVIAVVLAAGVVAAVAEPAEPASGSAISLLSASSDAARAAGTARITMDSTTSAQGQELRIAGDGVVDLRSGAMRFTLSILDRTIELRGDGRTAFIAVPEDRRAISAGKPWVSISADPAADGVQQIDITGQLDVLESLADLGGEVEELGDEEVSGVPTTRYRIVVDFARAIENAPAGAGQADPVLLAQAGLESFPLEVWLSEDGIPLRITTRLEGGSFRTETTVELSDFGVTVDVQLPGPEEVFAAADAAALAPLFAPTP